MFNVEKERNHMKIPSWLISFIIFAIISTVGAYASVQDLCFDSPQKYSIVNITAVVIGSLGAITVPICLAVTRTNAKDT